MRSDSIKRDPRSESDTFGCPIGKLETDLHFVSNNIKMYRKKSGPDPVQVVMPPNGRGFLVGVSMTGGHQRKIAAANTVTSHTFGVNSIYVRGFDDDYKAELSGSFDFVLLEISIAGLQNIAEHADVRYVERLKTAVAVPDRTLGGLANALFATARQSEPSKLFVDQVSQAIGAHLVRTYGGGRTNPINSRRVLSPERAARVKEILWNNLAANISIDELASSCLMSRDAFLEAFKNTLGTTPFGWIATQRMEIARTLLLETKLSLFDVATACGYSAQSQFTRAFAAVHGEPPGAWRKRRT